MQKLPEVIVDGRKVAPGSDEVMKETFDLINMANLARIRKNLEDRTSKGWTQGFRMTITDAPPGDGWRLDQLAQAISLTNDGPQQVLVGLNDFENPSLVNITEVFEENYEAHRLDRLYMQCPTPGGIALVRFTIRG